MFKGWYVAAAINVAVTAYTMVSALGMPDTFLAGLSGVLLIWALEGIYSAARPSPAAS